MLELHVAVRPGNADETEGGAVLRGLGTMKFGGGDMKLEELEAAALELDVKARARLAESLLASLETLSDRENAQLWADESERRDAEFDKDPGLARPAAEVLRDARSRLD